jgi:hypothetical protein
MTTLASVDDEVLETLRNAQEGHVAAISDLLKARKTCADAENAFEEAKKAVLAHETDVRASASAIAKALKNVEGLTERTKDPLPLPSQPLVNEKIGPARLAPPVKFTAPAPQVVKLAPPVKFTAPTSLAAKPAHLSLVDELKELKKAASNEGKAMPARADKTETKAVPKDETPVTKTPVVSRIVKIKAAPGIKAKDGRACGEPGCKREYRAKGYCVGHYVKYFPRKRK